jgi:hypothetical protein
VHGRRAVQTTTAHAAVYRAHSSDSSLKVPDNETEVSKGYSYAVRTFPNFIEFCRFRDGICSNDNRILNFYTVLCV